MEIFLRIDINLIALFMLVAILVIASKRLDQHDALNSAYFRVVRIVVLQLLFETTSCIVNKREELWLIPVSYVLHICLYITGGFIAYYGYILIRHAVLPNQLIEKKKRILLWLPIIINTILVLLSPIFHLVFYVNDENVYQRGNYFFVSILIIYMYLLLMLIVIITNRRKLVEYEYIILVVFSSLPMIGGIIQSLFYGALLMWSSTAFSLIMLYTYLQQRMVQLDCLTGVWSRGSFEFYMKNRFVEKNSNKLGVIYCDIDGLKEINDQNGHAEGDYAIKMTTQIIRKAIRKTDIVVRMGGDEFIVVLECDTLEILVRTLDAIESAFVKYNEISTKNYKLSCSFGADVFSSKYRSIEQFLNHVDGLMYTNKKLKKNISK